MKKIKVLLWLVLALLLYCNVCATQSYDATILDNAEMVTSFLGFNDRSENPFLLTTRCFNVTRATEDEFVIDVNGTEMIIQASSAPNDSGYTPLNIKDVSSNFENICSNSRALVYKYIDSSTILKNKEDIKEYIKCLSIKEATFTDEYDVGAYFSYTDNTLYINDRNSVYICEWMIVHELIHAVSFYTHDCCIDEETYAFNLFNEVITDIITSSLNPKISKDTMSGYTLYYSLVYPYIDIVGFKAIEAYFYGYDSVFTTINKDELDFFVLDLENYGEENSDVYYNNLIYKWYSN